MLVLELRIGIKVMVRATVRIRRLGYGAIGYEEVRVYKMTGHGAYWRVFVSLT